MNAILSMFIYLAVFAVAIIVIAVIIILFKRQSSRQPANSEQAPWPLDINKNFLTAAEQSFYSVLKLYAGDKFVICPKVNLNDAVHIRKGTEPGLRQSLFNQISRKHIDFILLDQKTLIPALAIELDDASHQTSSAQKRDSMKDKALQSAGLKLVRVPAKHAYTQTDLADVLSGEMKLHEAT